MAFFSWTTSLLLLHFPAFFFLGIAGGLCDELQRERVYAGGRIFVWYLLAAGVALGIVNAATGNREIMDIVRWKWLLLRGVRLLAVGLNAVACFILLDSAAGGLLGLRIGDDSTAVSSACAVLAVATHLRVGWMAVFED